jgi:hypothetical protein
MKLAFFPIGGTIPELDYADFKAETEREKQEECSGWQTQENYGRR